MKKIIVRILATIGGIVVLLSLLGWLQMWQDNKAPQLADQMVLALDLSETLDGNTASGHWWQQLMTPDEGVSSAVRALDRARRDERVLGLVARFGSYQPTLAEAQEIRAALQRFKSSGKFTVAFAPSFGEGDNALKSYYLASTMAEVWLQPVGLVGLHGLSVETPFLRGLLDKYGVLPEFATRKSYKMAAANLTDRGLSPANRTMMTSLLDSLSDQLIEGIAENRNLPPATVRQLFGRGPLNTNDALAAKLIDKVGYQDELLLELNNRAGDDARLTNLFDYLYASDHDLPSLLTQERPDPDKRVAIITLTGPIHLGHSVQVPRNESAGADSIVDAIADAVEDNTIKAIILRIDSPGGSPAASETIRRAVQLAQQGHSDNAAKPVIVSMGTVAASGAYWIASTADYIVANPATLTGSIGVVVGKVSVGQASRNFGINWDNVSSGAMANLFSPARGFNTAERRVVETMADDVYADFIKRVAEGRKLSPAAVESLAQGRVWTGQQARELQLVDALGGLDVAINKAKEKMGLSADTPVYLENLPRPLSRFERLLELAEYYQQFGVALPAFKAQLMNALAPLPVEAPALPRF